MPDLKFVVENARKELIREASRTRRPIYKLKNGTEVVRVKYRYASPEEVRAAYVEALDSLIADGSVVPVLTNADIELYELAGDVASVPTVPIAKANIMNALAERKQIYKIHSHDGEYLQAGEVAYNRFDDERITYLTALYDLLHHGQAKLVDENREIATIEMSADQSCLNQPLSSVRWP
ncbi:MAG TPA: hypothetical protein V6C72_01005 [Chroococcales cyanobacterium]